MPLDLSPDEIATADAIAAHIGSRWSRVRVDDVQSELRLWLCENHRHVVRWRGEGALGRNKLRVSLRRRANKYCRAEFDTIKPLTPEVAYSAEQTGALLEVLFAYADDWGAAAGGDSDLWACLADVSRAVQSLTDVDRMLLRWRFEAGRRFKEIGFELGGVSADAARMRVNRALRRVAERASVGTAHWPAHSDLAPRGELWANGEVGQA